MPVFKYRPNVVTAEMVCGVEIHENENGKEVTIQIESGNEKVFEFKCSEQLLSGLKGQNPSIGDYYIVDCDGSTGLMKRAEFDNKFEES